MLQKAGEVLIYLAKRIYQTPHTLQAKRVIPWFRDEGDKTLRLNYDLDENSLVFDLGGYKGQWASDIYGMYCCWIHVFEPVEEFAQKIKRRFSKNRKIIVHQFGLADKNQTTKSGLDQDTSSIFKPGGRLVEAKLVRAADFMQKNNIQVIDLMKINIEGAEYDLLEHLIETGMVHRIVNIQVQFHDFVPNAEQRMLSIQKELGKTHFLTYQYPFVWENWRRKKTQ